MAQRIIDLDAVVPETIGVRIDKVIYDLPGDIPVPKYLKIARLTDELAEPGEGSGGVLEALYDEVVDLFGELNDLPEDDEGKVSLPIGPTRLGALVIQLYAQAAEADDPRPTRARRAGTKSTSRTKPKRSASSK